MYHYYKLCTELKPKEICIVVEQYKEGIFERQYHCHVPKHRLSESVLLHLLKVLVLKFQNNELETIVRSHLNERGTEPRAYKLPWHADYPEPGVLRRRCGANICAWADLVVSAEEFRK